MLYPEKISAKKSNQIISILLIASILIAVVLTIINKLTVPSVHWAALANSGIAYVWVTVLYAINKNTNIAKHVLIQTIAISMLTLYIDNRLGFKGWSVTISVPIIIIIANITMFILTIVSHRRYMRYAFYQLLIIILSLIPGFFMFRQAIQTSGLTIIATIISAINFAVSLALCGRNFWQVVVRKFHM